MAKLIVFAAFFAALVALSTASTCTTTVVTTEVNPELQCQREIQRLRMTHCLQYIQSGIGGRAYEPSFLRSAVANPGRYQEEEHLEECCDEMRSVSSPCRGDAVRRMIVEMERYGMEEMETKKMVREKARALPQKCNLKSSPTMI